MVGGAPTLRRTVLCPAARARKSDVASQQVEGQSHRCISRFVDLTWQFTHGNPQHGDTAFPQPLIATNIAPRSIAHVVTRAIKLDRQTRLRTIEIQNVRTDWMLASKHRLSQLATAQAAPKACLRHRQIYAEDGAHFRSFALAHASGFSVPPRVGAPRRASAAGTPLRGGGTIRSAQREGWWEGRCAQ
jgi:hypothetical protein